mgnify:CR=1 FL=1
MTMPAALHVIPALGPRAFGPGPVAVNLVRSQMEAGWASRLWCLDADSETRRQLGSAVRTFAHRGPYLFRYSPAMEREVRRLTRGRFEVLHQHGVFTALSRVTLEYRKVFGGPTLIAPHGSLSPIALKRSSWKKRLALWGYESENLRSASCLHALGENELQHIRGCGLRYPVAIVPNGVDDQWLHSAGSGARFRARHSIPDGVRILLYLGRITPIKGLPLLIEALANAGPGAGDWMLVIGGGGEFGFENVVRAAVARWGVSGGVRFAGPLYGDDKRDAFAAAELFVLPSLSEACPIAVLEALGAGVPVICTEAVKFPALESCGCGWWTKISAAGLREALAQAFSAPASVLAAMGERGRRVVCARYRWPVISELLLSVYSWLLGGGSRPDFVLVEKPAAY